MTREEAIKWVDDRMCWGRGTFTKNHPPNIDECWEAGCMAIKALKSDRPKGEWTPIKWHTITEEEREREGYPKDWVYFLDCEMPEDGQEILVTTKYGCVEKDVCYLDDGYSLDSGWDWREDIVAWMPLPPVYQEEDNK